MQQQLICPTAPDTLAAVAAVFLLLLPAAGSAASKRLDYRLTDLETKVGSNSNFAAENRSVVVTFDDAGKALTVYQDGNVRSLNNVTITQISMNGYLDDISVGIDPSSLSIMLQTYMPDSTRTEFGTCTPSAEPPP